MKRLIATSLFTFLGTGCYLFGQQITVIHDDLYGCAPVITHFEVQDSTIFNGADSIIWNWGDGTAALKLLPGSFSSSVSHNYMTDGIMTVELKIYKGGIPDTYSESVIVFPRPVFSFICSEDTICPNTSVVFTPTITYPTTGTGTATYTWDFGDGNQGTGQNPTHFYASSHLNLAEDIFVKLTININACATMDSVNILHIRQKPLAKFKVDKPALCFNERMDSSQTVQFTDTSFSPTAGNTYSWLFGDNGTSTLQNPSHVYSGIGLWSVTLAIRDSHGCTDTLTQTDYVKMSKVTSKATVSDTILCYRGATVKCNSNFVDGESDWYSYWMATYPYGGTQDKLADEADIRYLNPGHYTLAHCYAPERFSGCADTAFFRIHVFDTVKGQVLVQDTNVCKEDAIITFRDNTPYKDPANYGFLSVTWLFGDSLNTIRTGNPVNFSYNARGEYVAKAVIRSPYGCVLDTVRQNIHIYPLHAKGKFVDPDPSNGPPTGCAPLHVEVTNVLDSLKTTSPVVDYTWFWDWEKQPDISNPHQFSTGLTPNAEHVYHDTGVFQIVMKITNAQGCWDTIRIKPVVEVGWIPFYDWYWDSTMVSCNLDEFGSKKFQVQVHAYPILKDSISKTWLTRDSIAWEQVVSDNCAGGKDTTYKRKRINNNYKPIFVKEEEWNFLTNTPDIGAPFNEYDTIITTYNADQTPCESHRFGKDDTLGWVLANSWAWLDDQDNPLSTGKDGTITTAPQSGWLKVSLVPSHNGCAGPKVTYDSIGYLCPPKAGIKSPSFQPPPAYVVSCGLPCLGTAPCTDPTHNHKNIGGLEDGSDKGLMHYWRFNDSSTYDSAHGYWTNFVSDTIINGTDEEPSFCYELGVYDSVRGYPLSAMVKIALISINDDTVKCKGGAPNPDYNPCGFCQDSTDITIGIALGQPNLTSDKRDWSIPSGPGRIKQSTVCMGESIHIIDSSWSNWHTFDWFLSEHPTEPTRDDFPKGPWDGTIQGWEVQMVEPTYGGEEPVKPRPWEGISVQLIQDNIYRVFLKSYDLIDVYNQQCEWTDTMDIYVRPRSIPSFKSNKTRLPWGAYQVKTSDTLCANRPDTFYVMDNSYTASPYGSTLITFQEWKLYDQGTLMAIDTGVTGRGALYSPIGGVYDVEYTVGNEYGCDTTVLFTDRVIINAVKADFAVISSPPNSKVFCYNTNVGFTNNSSIAPVALHDYVPHYIKTHWQWGDGDQYQDTLANNARGTDRRVYHKYSHSMPDTMNTVVVTITVTAYYDRACRQPIGCSETFSDTIIIRRPLAGFHDLGHNFPCVGDTGAIIHFFDSSKGVVSSWTWDFGDGTTQSYAKNPTHTYTTAGTYEVMLRVDDSEGCYDSVVKKNYVVVGGPSGNYTFTPESGCTRLQVTFTQNPDVKNCDSVRMYFGDGTSSLYKGLGMRTFVHNYTAAGAHIPYFTMYKTVGDSLCKVNIWKEDTIWAIDLTPDFIYDSINGYCPNMPITFVESSRIDPDWLSPDSILWDFGNGLTDSINLNGVTEYDSAGFYTVVLTEQVKACTQTVSHEIKVIHIPDLTFSPDTAAACDGLSVKFQVENLLPEDSANIVSFIWAFSDGDTLIGNPVYREFSTSGIYPFTVDAEFKPTGCVHTYLDTVVVNAYVSPVADFEANPEEAEVGEAIQFTDKTTPGDGVIDSLKWDFGDGETLTGRETNVSHAYNNTSGYVTVTLEVIDQYGCRSNAEKQVLIIEALAFSNVLTPFSNGKQYFFRPLEDKGFFEDFKMEIYDRWGMLVWKKHCKDGSSPCPDYNNETSWWDGRNKQGNYASDGVYFWVVYAKPLSGANPIVLNGSVTVFNGK
jgi:PKD repeat protein